MTLGLWPECHWNARGSENASLWLLHFPCAPLTFVILQGVTIWRTLNLLPPRVFNRLHVETGNSLAIKQFINYFQSIW